ncbi:MAG: hypothetical protein JSS66_09805 [Armatimonadetes bacterium]|nr:hypothetical protein [Armatimonadota bacterium]
MSEPTEDRARQSYRLHATRENKMAAIDSINSVFDFPAIAPSDGRVARVTPIFSN